MSYLFQLKYMSQIHCLAEFFTGRAARRELYRNSTLKDFVQFTGKYLTLDLFFLVQLQPLTSSYFKKHRWTAASSLGYVIKEIFQNLGWEGRKFSKNCSYDKVYLDEAISCFSRVYIKEYSHLQLNHFALQCFDLIFLPKTYLLV